MHKCDVLACIGVVVGASGAGLGAVDCRRIDVPCGTWRRELEEDGEAWCGGRGLNGGHGAKRGPS